MMPNGGPVAVTYIRDLITEARAGDPVAVEEVLDSLEHALEQPDVIVAVAFQLADEPATVAAIRVRDDLYRSLDNSLLAGLSLRQRAEIIQRKRKRYVPRSSDKGAQGERAALWQLHSVGAPDLSERQIRRILGGR